MNGYRKLPDNYRPYVNVEQAINAYQRNFLDEMDFTIMKVLGDAIAANEDQIRRYLISKISRSDTSKRLDRLRRNGFVDRWHCRLENDTDNEIRPPAPFTLGIAGFKLMNHFYPHTPFMNPNSWDNQNIKTLQRYVAMNELRCLLVESKSINNWHWNSVVAHNRRLKKPLGTAELETTKGNVNFIMERAQMSQNFVGFLRDKLHQWKKVYEQESTFPLTNVPDNVPVFIIYTSTLAMAEHIHKQIMLDTFPFTVWTCVEEFFEADGLAKSFYAPQGESLKRLYLEFLEKN
ncbi:hypothetical protein ACFVAD_18830 [Sutcliffiella sp. NPDC057660]|uniref:hypothetical protein n=1 Tax=Sutcliffiella sp. NPDC057660 TaxID=3346199 RepID=UPI00368ED12B